MEIFNRLPEELKYAVYRLDASHRKNFYPTLIAIPLAGIQGRVERLKKLFGKVPSINQYMAIAKTVSDPDYFVRILSTCRCCSRHQTNRPKHLKDMNFPEYGCIRIPKKGEFVEMCECECRSVIRTMCRL